jgi:hypothetical protein
MLMISSASSTIALLTRIRSSNARLFLNLEMTYGKVVCLPLRPVKRQPHERQHSASKAGRGTNRPSQSCDSAHGTKDPDSSIWAPQRWRQVTLAVLRNRRSA